MLSEETSKPEEPKQEEQAPAEVLNKDDILIMVENGAGIPGIAGKTTDIS